MSVVPTFQPLKHGHLGFGLGAESPTAQQFSFERSEEALGHGVIVCITYRTNRGRHSGFLTAARNGC